MTLRRRALWLALAACGLLLGASWLRHDPADDVRATLYRVAESGALSAAAPPDRAARVRREAAALLGREVVVQIPEVATGTLAREALVAAVIDAEQGLATCDITLRDLDVQVDEDGRGARARAVAFVSTTRSDVPGVARDERHVSAELRRDDTASASWRVLRITVATRAVIPD